VLAAQACSTTTSQQTHKRRRQTLKHNSGTFTDLDRLSFLSDGMSDLGSVVTLLLDLQTGKQTSATRKTTMVAAILKYLFLKFGSDFVL
jgi:hypothetical protein